MGADVAGIEGLQDALVIPLVEHAAADVLGLQHVGGNIAGLMLDLGLAQNLVGVQVGDDQVQAGIHLFKGLLSLQHFGGGRVNIDGGVLLQSLLIQLLVGHVTPLIIIGAIELFASLGVTAQVQGAPGGLLGSSGISAGRAGLLALLASAAGRQAENHHAGQQQC